jgi:hypothetical protein
MQRIFTDVDEFKALVDGYFTKCSKDKRRPNHIGLANHLSVLVRTLNDYKSREGFDLVLAFAKQRIEEERTDMLFNKDVPTAGVIFDLVNNYGWVNSQRNEHSGPHGGPIAVTSTPMPADVQNEIDAHKEELAGE